jgi:hypothetical protein
MTQRKKWLDVTVLVVVMVAMVLAGLGAWYGRHEDQRQAEARQREQTALIECLNRFANQMADALEGRTDTAAPRDQAQRRFYYALLGLTKGQDTRGAAEKAIQDYVTADQKLQQERVRKPYPAPPREVCPRG